MAEELKRLKEKYGCLISGIKSIFPANTKMDILSIATGKDKDKTIETLCESLGDREYNLVISDINNNLMQYLAERLIGKPYEPNLSYVLEDATKFSFEDNSYDLIVGTRAVEMLMDYCGEEGASKMVNEASRVLRNKGYAIFIEVRVKELSKVHVRNEAANYKATRNNIEIAEKLLEESGFSIDKHVFEYENVNCKPDPKKRYQPGDIIEAAILFSQY